MSRFAIRLVTNDRLVRGTHWTIFTVGAVSLTVSVTATLINHFIA